MLRSGGRLSVDALSRDVNGLGEDGLVWVVLHYSGLKSDGREEEHQRAHGPHHQPVETKLPRQTCNKNLDISTHEVLPRYAGLRNRHSSGDGSHTRHYHIYTLNLLCHFCRLLWETASPQVLLQEF